MDKHTITLSGSGPVDRLRDTKLDIKSKVASATATLRGDSKSVASRLVSLRSRNLPVMSADVFLKGATNQIASAIAPLAGNPASAAVRITNASRAAFSNVVRMSEGVIDWISARVLVSTGALASSFVTALRGVSLSSAQITVRGTRAAVVSSITAISGVVGIVSMRMNLKSDAEKIALALMTLRGSGAIDVSARVGLRGGADRVASSIEPLRGGLPVSVRVGLAGKATDVVSSLISIGAASYRVDLNEGSEAPQPDKGAK